MFLRVLLLFGILALASAAVCAQTSGSGQPEEQNETMLDTLKRMQIKREENDHRKLIERAAEIKDNIEAIIRESGEAGASGSSRIYDKRLRDIEKYARQIRSESGGGADEELEDKPDSLEKTLDRLRSAGEKLNESLAKTSRQVVSVAVISRSNEIIQLVRIVRGFLN